MVYQGYGSTTNPNLSSSSDQNRKIFLGGLNYHTTDETLRSFCSRFGKMTDCLVMRNAEGKSRGFGFVTYEDTSSVEEFMRSRPHTIDSRQIDPKRAMPREEQNSTEAHLTVKKLFVAGLREGITEESLRQYFSRFGNVMEVLVMKDRDGKPRGFAFVTFDDYDAVDKAVLEKPHIINGRNLDVKKAVPKEKMQEESGGNGGGNLGGGGGGPDMPPFNRSNSSNYSGPKSGPPAPNQPRNNYGSMRDNYNNGNNNWDNQGAMSRMNTQNPNYNQPPTGPYGQQGGYDSHTSGYNHSLPSNSGYPQPFNQMGQSQPPPPPPPSSQQSSMMSYDMYNNSSSMPFNMNPNQTSASNYMQPNSSSYGSNPQQSFSNNPNSFGNMNSPFNLPPPPPPPSSGGSTGYSNVSSAPAPFDNSNSYGITSQNYSSGSYGGMPQQQSRGGGPMRGGRGGGNGGNYGGPPSGDSSYGSRPAPYPSRGGRGNGRGGGRGRGRGQ